MRGAHWRPSYCTRWRRDHPRGCGEHSPCSRPAMVWRGSSPRMRGARVRFRSHFPLLGIIPADAGSTHGLTSLTLVNRDHPRGCGEHIFRHTSVCFPSGSSPRMRGAQRPEQRDRHDQGIIPADAGSTHPGYRRIVPCQDHPRGCGEHYWQRSWPVWSGGSSPRMRGAPGHIPADGDKTGIIPADAGSTGCRRR